MLRKRTSKRSRWRLEVLAEEWDMDRLDGDLRREGYNAWKGGLSR